MLSYSLYFMCDSYMGCDQEYKFNLNIQENISFISIMVDGLKSAQLFLLNNMTFCL